MRTAGEEEALRADPTYESQAHQHQAYVARGQYIDALRRLEKILGRSRIHVVDSHRFFSDPEPTFAATLEFLGLPPSADIDFERHNARPRSPMADHVRARLEAHFAPYDAELGEWLGWQPSWRE